MKSVLKYTILMILMVLIFGAVHISYGEGLIEYSAPQPKDMTVFVSKPTIAMELILNNNKIQSIDMKMNGAGVDGKYDLEKRAIVYTPLEPLKPGQYKVDLVVTFEGWKNDLSQSWKFTIGENATDQLALPSDEQKQVLKYINSYRKALGLGELKLNNHLNVAAMAHANYMAINKKTTHEQFVNDKGFIGAQPYNRAGAYGYFGSTILENISSGQKDYRESLEGLMNAPYHRVTFLNPFLKELGYGGKDKYYTFDLWGPKVGGDKIIVFPMENHKDVPAGWNGKETPNPLRFYGSSKEVGYPITLSYYSEKTIEKLTIDKALLTDDKGKTIYSHLNTPSNDTELKNSMILIPTKPLENGKTYRVTVKGKIAFKDRTTQSIDRVWSFTTAASTENSGSWISNGLYGDMDQHWAKNDLLSLWNRKIFLSKEANLFMPDDKITRGEFAEFVVKILGIELKPFEGSFSDVKKETPKALYIEGAHREGIVKGIGLGNFSPNQPITREEMAVMIIRAHEKKKASVKTVSPLTFMDKDHISPWAVDEVAACYTLGIIKGRDHNRFIPKDSATRAEAAVMGKKLLDLISK